MHCFIRIYTIGEQVKMRLNLTHWGSWDTMILRFHCIAIRIAKYCFIYIFSEIKVIIYNLALRLTYMRTCWHDTHTLYTMTLCTVLVQFLEFCVVVCIFDDFNEFCVCFDSKYYRNFALNTILVCSLLWHCIVCIKIYSRITKNARNVNRENLL